MKQENRRLFALSSNFIQSFYPNSLAANSVAFYDINIIRIKKNPKEAAASSSANQYAMPQMDPELSNTPPRSRADSTVKDKSKVLNEQLNESKLNEKAKLISRMARMGQQMMPGAGNTHANDGFSMVTEADDDWEKSHTLLQQNTGQDFSLNANVNANANNNNSVTAALLLQQQQQNQQLQQQLALQQQQQQLAAMQQQANSLNQASNNQLALCKHTFSHLKRK